MESESTNPLGEGLTVPMNIREDELLTGAELCAKLKVKQSFLYAPERRKGPDAIPCIKVGKYLRYHLPTVCAHLEKLNRPKI